MPGNPKPDAGGSADGSAAAAGCSKPGRPKPWDGSVPGRPKPWEGSVPGRPGTPFDCAPNPSVAPGDPKLCTPGFGAAVGCGCRLGSSIPPVPPVPPVLGRL